MDNTTSQLEITLSMFVKNSTNHVNTGLIGPTLHHYRILFIIDTNLSIAFSAQVCHICLYHNVIRQCHLRCGQHVSCHSKTVVCISFLFVSDNSEVYSIPFVCETKCTTNEVGRVAEWTRRYNEWLFCISMRLQSKICKPVGCLLNHCAPSPPPRIFRKLHMCNA